MENELARCFSGRLPVVGSYTPHFGEEPALTGTKGAGNVFFGNCNSRNSLFRDNSLHTDSLIVDGFEINNYEHPNYS